MKKLTLNQCEVLDLRYTAYNPDQEVSEDDPHFDVVCPLHGPYRLHSEQLHRKYTGKHLKPPSCPDCMGSRMTDRQYMSYLEDHLRYKGHEVLDGDYPLHPEFEGMPHWYHPWTGKSAPLDKRQW